MHKMTKNHLAPSRMEKAAPVLWILVNWMKPGINSLVPVLRTMFAVAQYLTA